MSRDQNIRESSEVVTLDIAAECRRLIDRGTKPSLTEVWPIISAWYARPENAAGGELHCELDDHNHEQHFWIDNLFDEKLSEDARLISGVVLLLSPTQRRKI